MPVMDFRLKLFGILVILLAVASCVHGCTQCTSDVLAGEGYTLKTYTSSDADVINPERGGTIFEESFDDAGLGVENNLTQAMLNSALSTYGPISIIWRMYYLDYLLEIPQDYKDLISTDFAVLRQNGFKAVIRFAYSKAQGAGTTEDSKTHILGHITKLTDLLTTNVDVILTVQIGFIGVKGEWYYSDQFGDEGVINVQKWGERRDVVTALLAAVPTSRTLQIRTPEYKRQIVESTVPTAASNYRSTTNTSARIGHHNDCFLYNATDSFTYTNVAVDYPYLEEDTKYVPMGGSTCAVNAPRTECTKAKEELAKFHWTYLNLIKDVDVINSWKTGGCYDEIMKKLGYRLRLTEVYLPNNVTTNGDACFKIKFRNDGYAAPVNARDVKVVLRKTTGNYDNYTSSHIAAFTQAEPWLPESQEMTVSFSLKFDVPVGDYEVLLELGDPLLAGRPEYNIILLNQNVPEFHTGLNNLNHVITVTATGTTGVCDGFTSKAMTTTVTATRCSSSCSGLRFTYPETTNPTTDSGAFHCLPSFTLTCLLAIVSFLTM